MNWTDFLGRHVFDLLAMLVALLLAAFINGTEAAMFSLSPGQLYRMRQSNLRPARIVGKLLQSPRRTLNTLLLANLLMTTAIAALTALIVIDLDGQA